MADPGGELEACAPPPLFGDFFLFTKAKFASKPDVCIHAVHVHYAFKISTHNYLQAFPYQSTIATCDLVLNQ